MRGAVQSSTEGQREIEHARSGRTSNAAVGMLSYLIRSEKLLQLDGGNEIFIGQLDIVKLYASRKKPGPVRIVLGSLGQHSHRISDVPFERRW